MKRPAVPIAVIAVAAALFGLLVYGIAAGGNDTTLDDAVKRGERPVAPGADLERRKVDGTGSLKLADLRGEIVVLNFWGSWCEPCKDEAPVLKRIHERLADAGKGTVLGATYNDPTADTLAFERENDIDYPSVQDVSTDLYDEFGGTGVPETFVIDPQGRITAISRGQVSEEFLDTALRKLGA
ncbi:TlpA family protein disulfide reductase [Paraconexibacter sp.]|uniref:TlpA family protein disulfide reductase n=1 Tax=Paraconexibacter sp. TaxID=2949640 RepID=UPI00356ABDF8